MEYIANSIEDLPQIAKSISKLITNNTVFAFYGEMGTGKTTLIVELCKQLKVEGEISSPTYSIVNEYFSLATNKPLYHFDMYRIENEEEALDFGIEDYLFSGNLCLIEWPEKIPNLLPKDHVEIVITDTNGQRKFTIKTK